LGTPDELDRAFAPLCAVVRNAVRFIGRDRRWPMFDRLPIPSWTSGRITLLGDAAHPMLQYIAQGACQALEDSVCLGNALGTTSRLERRVPGLRGRARPPDRTRPTDGALFRRI
jgi:2-polyprenyl-6-methoxyphenol hydroxylase-like FAD-dependent oxidoreductase